ncbi:hypothetical protein [Natrarchaeobius chitinivorans]|uniref:Uncharacterized protein n=1 Tax=Natrarchaeobius chitinivorans TaxID=1679083 RepID=A0A3N6M3F9_NATCH|nr:hypothetical protein [Natrarchaeobius chitinivorans]RQG96437.1 hypothetical protein EA473_04760 [Natrarchaeobius chitinivorans]
MIYSKPYESHARAIRSDGHTRATKPEAVTATLERRKQWSDGSDEEQPAEGDPPCLGAITRRRGDDEVVLDESPVTERP